MRAIVLITLAVAVLLAGLYLRRRSGHRPVQITVSSDPAALAAARGASKQDLERRLTELLANPEGIYPEFREQAIVIAADRPRVIATLTQLRDDAEGSPARRVAAGIASLVLGEAGSIDQLVGLAGDDPAARRVLLQRLDDIVPRDAPIPASLHPLIREGLATPRSGPHLARIAAAHRMTEVADAVLQLARQTAPAGDPWLASAASLQPTMEVVDLALSRLVPVKTFGAPPGLQALLNAATHSEDPAVRERALGAVVAHLREQADVAWIDGVTMMAVETLEKLPPPAGAAALADVILNSKWTSLRVICLRSLATLDAARAEEIAKQTGLSRDARKGGTPRALVSEMTGREAAATCVRYGLLDAAAADAALAAMPSKLSLDEIVDDARSFLAAAHLYTSFDVETGVSPNRHDLLILELSELSTGRFQPEAVLETYLLESEDDETGRYAVQFIHADRLYSFEPQDLGDWYDLETVFAALDRALQDAGASERYILLQPDGQTAEMLFGDPVKVRGAALELGLTLSDDADSAMRMGKDFETKVLDGLGKPD